MIALPAVENVIFCTSKPVVPQPDKQKPSVPLEQAEAPLFVSDKSPKYDVLVADAESTYCIIVVSPLLVSPPNHTSVCPHQTLSVGGGSGGSISPPIPT